MKLVDYFLDNKSAPITLNGILDGVLACGFFVAGYLKFRSSDYPGAAFYMFISLSFQMQSLYYLILAKLEEMK